MDQPLPKPVPDSSDSERRLEKLEEQLTFQQRALDQLNEVVFQQQSDLAKLRLQWTSCRAEVDRLAELELGDDLPHEKPPHY